MIFIRLFKEKHEQLATAQAIRRTDSDMSSLFSKSPPLEYPLYEQLRLHVPVIDACIAKIVRLTGSYTVKCEDERFQRELDGFVRGVKVGISGETLQSFTDCFLDSLLTYGNAVGEILCDVETGRICGLYNADSTIIDVIPGKSPVEREFYIGRGSERVRIRHPERLVFSALNPTPRSPLGVSVLRGLPALSGILMRIYECIGQNFERLGNIRYAVTYKPSSETGDRGFAQERAQAIAAEWSAGMNAAKNGEIRDFVAVGDIGIKVIGSESTLIDTAVPVRQLLEQIVAKLSLPPFLLGLSWSSTERMSKQQADLLTSELEFYRRLLNPVISKICTAFLRLSGSDSEVFVEWGNINLQDETELALARLRNAQAARLEVSG